MKIFKNIEEATRNEWLKKTLMKLPKGIRILDAGAGQLRNKPLCQHLDYVSQDFCQYGGEASGAPEEGLQNKKWDTSRIDLVSDILSIPAPDESFDCILCSEVLEHVPEPEAALTEFTRLLKPGGVLILTAPFSSNVHQAPYFFVSGFSRYWYEYHLDKRGFVINELSANGDWQALLLQEMSRLGGLEKLKGVRIWPLAYCLALLGNAYFKMRGKRPRAHDLACFGWHCVAVKL